MPTRGEMQSLAEEIVRSYEDRIKVIPELKQAEAEREQAAIQEIAQRRSDVGTMLQGFDEAHAEMSQELRAKLAGDEQERRSTTAQEITQRRSDVGAMLQGFDAAHAAMSRELEADLAKVTPALRQAEAERNRAAAQEIAQRRSDVSTMLKGFDEAHAEMSQELRAKLAGDEQERRSTTAQEITQRRSDVSAMLEGFREEQAGVRDEWQRLTATMQANRGAPAVEMKPPVAVAPPPVEVALPPVQEVAPPPPVIEEMAEEEAVARAELADITPEFATLRDRVFAHLADHPDGTRLVEMEQEFGRPRIQMARVVRSLMDEGKVEKRDLLYFAI